MYKPVPSKPDFPALELEILKFWDERKIFERLVAQNRGGPRYSFIDGPITANNPMGVHHAWGRTYKDIYQRFWAMRGYDERYQNGFDCQGLWVEVEVERALGLNSKRQIEEYGLDRFADACRERVLTYAGVITKQSVRLGQWMDWDNSYYTMSDNNIEHIWAFLKRCQDNGWLYKGWRTMPWCIRCGTSLSQHELVGTDSYRDVVHPSIYVKMALVDRPGEFLLVWTTTPWTLPANVALAVHPDLDYVKIARDGETYYLSEKTGTDVLGADQQAVGRVKGSQLVGLRYHGPFDELPAQSGIDHHVVAWTDVGEEEGTGIVHIAPGCGAEDFTLGQTEGLPVLVPIGENGDYVAGYGPWTGRNVRGLADELIAAIREHGALLRAGTIEHRYPTCWRCGQEIVFRGVSEWFISADEIRPRLIDASRTVDWTPSSAGKRMEDWLTHMQDWCISRKRYWGLPLPFYPCEMCEKLVVVGSMDELRSLAVSGLDEVRELHRPWIDAVRIRCPGCARELSRIPDVGDCWLDAGVVPFSTLGPGSLKDRAEWERWYPADWVSEMREQIRLWFYSMLFMSVTMEGRSPYQRVLTYEKLMDEAGHPMHKSLGNAIWFDEAAERMGADIMRWLYASQNLTSNLLFGFGPAEATQRKLLTLWNVYSFFVTYATIAHFVPGQQTRPSTRRMDRWVLSQLDALVGLANDRLEAYDVASLVEAVDRFVDDLSTWYLRRGRRRFGRTAASDDAAAAYNTLHECLVTLARLLAPIMPFLAEELYQNLVRAHDASAPESVHLTPYPMAGAARVDRALDEEMDLARAVVTLCRAARNDANLRIRQPLAKLTIASETASVSLSEELRAEIADELNVKRVEIADNVETFARKIVRPNPRLLGPRLGREFPTVAAALQRGEFSLRSDGSVAVLEHVLSPDEVSIVLEPHADQAVAQDMHLAGGLAVALDRSVTDELRAEGRVRELVRRVQMMRRDAGLNVEDRIELEYDGTPAWRELFGAFVGQIQDAVGASHVREMGARPNGSDTAQTWSGSLDGEQIHLSVRAI